ncbi:MULTISPECIES: zinc metalloprotease HtpX [Acidianus]|uniref:Protease HtpX homolog n=1 Tax=Candidatus Acidianus copahuensis TaxID=1160895 RepID=A0A031LSR3_9CREN|nr:MULTISPECIES: zinc metalloprotease HtpX [Acidianus]EZQ10861.1 heat shock protein HtpX [Candidatus Acidianus copahuensis]NON62005.1 zinc metalloprotease HtpX [Acidianus sp. RZ1]
MNLTVLKLKLGMLFTTLSILLLGFAVAFAVVAYLYGVSFAPLVISGILGFVAFFSIIQWLLGPYMINAMYKAVEVSPEDPRYGWLVGLVNEVAMYNKLSTPKVYIADVPFPNAFAYGSPLTGNRVAITLPLLKMLNKDEIMAVLGHELGHLRHKDVQLLMAVGLIPTLMFWLGYTFIFSGMFGGEGNGRNNAGTLWLVGIAMLAISYVFQFFVLFLNRMREAYADVNSALTVPGGAENLQRALAKITLSTDPRIIEKYKQRNSSKSLTNMLFFSPVDVPEDVSEASVDELIEHWKKEKVHWYDDFFSDHPASPKRIQLLEKLKDEKAIAK